MDSARLNARDWINSESGTPITLSLSPMSKGNNSSGRPVGVHKQTDSQISVRVIRSRMFNTP